MAENLVFEAREIEKWRRRYMHQAVAVLAAVLVVVGMAWFFVVLRELRLLLSLGGLIVAVLMLKELRAALQVRAENLILAKQANWTDVLVFDDGQGLNEAVLRRMMMSESELTRECRTVIKGLGFVLEEDWFYDTISKGGLSFHKTEFEGIILALSFSGEACQGRFVRQKGQFVPEGNIVSRLLTPLFRTNLKQVAEALLSKEVRLFVADGSLYLWFKTEERLFYQFNLWSANTPFLFIKRVQQLVKMVQALDKAITD